MELIIPRVSTGRKKNLNVFKRHRERNEAEERREEERGGREGWMDTDGFNP